MSKARKLKQLRRYELCLVVKCDTPQNVVAEDQYVFPAMVPGVADKRLPTRATNMALWEGEVQRRRSTWERCEKKGKEKGIL